MDDNIISINAIRAFDDFDSVKTNESQLNKFLTLVQLANGITGEKRQIGFSAVVTFAGVVDGSVNGALRLDIITPSALKDAKSKKDFASMLAIADNIQVSMKELDDEQSDMIMVFIVNNVLVEPI